MDFELQFSDKEITPWGGMALIPHPTQSQRGWNHQGVPHRDSFAKTFSLSLETAVERHAQCGPLGAGQGATSEE